jgi:hypothetical protein
VRSSILSGLRLINAMFLISPLLKYGYQKNSISADGVLSLAYLHAMRKAEFFFGGNKSPLIFKKAA